MACFSRMKTVGQELHAFIARLYPICRSITGAGVEETLRIIQEQIPIKLHHVSSGTRVFDWSVPKEWNIRDAWIKNSSGQRIVDFQKLNLHVVNYSVPVRDRLRLSALRHHLFTLPEHPDWVPYRTSYYEETWGFCLSQNQLKQFNEDEEYDVCIDSSLHPGRLTYGELLLKGDDEDEMLISCHICHPSLANDNLSGVAVAVELARDLSHTPHRYSYRFLFIPGTIGAITWLARNQEFVARIKNGLVLACLGDSRHLSYKKSRRGDARIDRAFAHVLRHASEPGEIVDFSPTGYDERQYCSPGFNLPVGCLTRGRPGEFPEYHTSADNLDLVRPEALADSVEKCRVVIEILEQERVFLNQNPKGEPQLGRRGLFKTHSNQLALLWVLNLSDGEHSLLDIAEISGLPFAALESAAADLVASGLLVSK